MAEAKHPQGDQYKGWLYKWTNYIKGYQKRWFVLQHGLLSYYRNQAEMSHTCRGTINLANAFIHTEDSCSFVISNGGTQTFHLKASSEIERQRWVTALELAKAKAVAAMDSDDEDDMQAVSQSQPDRSELESSLKVLNQRLEDLNTCNDLINKHGAALQRALTELEQLEASEAKVKAINERATLFRITSNAMINACKDFVDLAQTSGRRWQRLIQHEHEQRIRLEDMVETLAKQHVTLEKAAQLHSETGGDRHLGGPLVSDEDDDFFDAVTDHKEDFTTLHLIGHQRTASGVSLGSCHHDDSTDSDTDSTSRVIKSAMATQTVASGGVPAVSAVSLPADVKFQEPVRKRRMRIPERPNHSINLWSIMKNCIGKELSKIPMPVNFSEPLSFLQRLTEDFEYSSVLDTAAVCPDRWEQLAHVAAFTVSAYSTTTSRTGKPFNPLLGETYECDRRPDMGWRSLAEQVSHHPPTCALHTHSIRGWEAWQEFTMSSKFRGKYLQIIPLGIAHLVMGSNHYTWRKVTTTVHNIIVGRLWVDNHGDMEIHNHVTGDLCHIKYAAYSYFSRDAPHKVSGVISDKDNRPRYVIQGTWDESIEGAAVIKASEVKGKTVFETGPAKTLWKRRLPPPDLESCYNFTEFAVTLNEPEDDVAPTDCRNRPDQREMEIGNWDEANRLKILLEEKQRNARKKREQATADTAASGDDTSSYEPCWFRKAVDSHTGNTIHHFTGEYWKCKDKQDWTRCPNIFL